MVKAIPQNIMRLVTVTSMLINTMCDVSKKEMYKEKNVDIMAMTKGQKLFYI